MVKGNKIINEGNKMKKVKGLTIMNKVIQKCKEDGKKKPIIPKKLLENIGGKK